MAEATQRGRDAFARGDWAAAFADLARADRLDDDDLERLAVAAHMVGERDVSGSAWTQAHRRAAQRDDAERAARCAFWLGFDFLLRGEEAHAGGRLGRAQRAADEAGEVATVGLLLLAPFLGELGGGRAAAALELTARMAEIADRCGDADLHAFALLCRGEALLALGELGGGMRHLDEAMVWITAGEVSPIATGIIYCAVIEACVRARDPRRAAEWVDALDDWCGPEPGAAPYRGQCLVHRSQVLTARGAWDDAWTAAQLACARLAESGHPALGDALYQRGELHRLRGELDRAEQAYRDASRHGCEPVPGLCLLRLSQGRGPAAASSVRRLLAETAGIDRPVILAAAVEVLVAVGAIDEAAVASVELDGHAGRGGEMLDAMAATARALVLLERGELRDASAAAREAVKSWRRLEMPFEEARARTLLSRICDALGDHDAAGLERNAARAVFEGLGLATAAGDAAPLSSREREVLRAVAGGSTNRAIASALHISEHTVARHLQNIFGKLGVSSRAAATAWAYEHGVV